MPQSTRLVTAEDLERMPEANDCRYELVQGRLIRMSPVGFLHGVVVASLLRMMGQHAKAHKLGFAVTEVGFKLATDPDTVRAPDVAFVRRERIPRAGPSRRFVRGAPDLAVEVLSPEDRPSEVQTKVDEYLTYGVPMVLVIDPDDSIVHIHRRGQRSRTLTVDDTLDLDDVVDGFRCQVREIFD